MRRIRQQLPEEECIEILKRASDGVLALNGDAGYNYAVPLNFAYKDGCIHFHCAKKGHKIDAIRRNPRVSFCVVDANDVDAEGMATDYRSVILFGYARILEDPEEIRASARLIGEKYSSAYRSAYEAEIDREFPALACVEIRIEHITGKEGKALAEKRAGEGC
ncbi:MAG: pyridoxamine 5'-phosphate oxidase family protein [Eubacterium sp.]|nr:pyridoxamine 5'-phosphate oxidase family protein [Eubacterium sp.]